MKFTIKHEIRGRIRIHNCQKTMSADQADELQYYLITKDFVTSVKIYDRTNDIVICYDASRSEILTALKEFYHGIITVPDNYQESQSRQLNQTYQEKLISKVLFHYGNKLLFPYPLRAGITVIKSVKYIYEGIHTLAQGKIEVPVLDGTAIGVSIIRRDINTASSIMFLLGIGEILEEWTHKKSVDDLAKSMSLNIDKVWKVEEDHEILVPSNEIDANDIVHIQMGNMIPFDGVVVDGEAMVNQASLTGESTPVRKIPDGYVYAGTVVEEGDLKVCVKEVNGSSKFDKIVTMIEESEKLKSSLESKAEHLADRLVPYTLAGTALTYLFTRNVTKALSVLMVDFSCALKLAMPISVLSAIKEANDHQIVVKGGKYLEAMAEAETIVFDKTGTLTKAEPTVLDIVSFNGMKCKELLRIAACLEEHFPHSMAKAVVQAAVDRNLVHEELHSEVEYIVAHGISSMIENKKVVIYLPHFLSWVVLATVVTNMFSLDGPINAVISAFGGNPIYFLADNKWFRTVIVGTDVWKEFGYNSVVYLAALTGIDPGLFEAASIDGANRFKQILNITVPALLPTVVLMTALNLGNILNAGFDQVFNLYNPIVYETGDIIDTYVYRIGMVERQYSIGTAVGLLKSVISFVLILSANKLAQKTTGSGIF